MCGICGILSTKTIDHQIVSNMNNALIHRGPDGEGFYTNSGISIGMRRLSIIDLNSGWQPLYNEDKSVVVMVNGEIYNYKELREELIKKNHSFQTNGDGETIVHLYEEYGIDCVKFLRGMFAFIVYDLKKNIAYLVRDRMGEKPLYLYKTNDTLLFSSELRSLLSSKKIQPELDPFSIDLFFHYHYIPEPYTAIKGVRKLPAAHYIQIDLSTFNVNEVNYWRMEDSDPISSSPTKVLRDQLHETSKLILRADVPIGIALSGGIDSGMVAALARKNYTGDLHAISIGYEGSPESDERTNARMIAEHVGLKFHQVEINDNEFISMFPYICSYTDDPIADISAFGYYSVSKKSRELGIPVMLQGQGGDELFWGYGWVKENYKLVKLKSNLLNHNRKSTLEYYTYTFNQKAKQKTLKSCIKGLLTFNEAKQLLQKHLNESKEIFPLYDYFKSFNWSEQYLNSFYGDALLDRKIQLDVSAPFKVEQPWGNSEVILTRLMCSTYLLENGIAQGDRLSMANSVELRLPLVDYRFVETTIGIRKNNSDINLEPKHFLKEIGKDLLPEWVFTNRKRGFEPPVEKWLNLLIKKYGDVLPNGHLVKLGILNKEKAIELSKGIYEPQPAFPSYFNALVLEFWYDGLIKSINKNS